MLSSSLNSEWIHLDSVLSYRGRKLILVIFVDSSLRGFWIEGFSGAAKKELGLGNCPGASKVVR